MDVCCADTQAPAPENSESHFDVLGRQSGSALTGDRAGPQAATRGYFGAGALAAVLMAALPTAACTTPYCVPGPEYQ